MVKKPINIILHVEINYNSFDEDYQNNFLDKIDLEEIKNDLDIPDTDTLTFNGGWDRDFYYSVNGIIYCTEIYIRKLNWSTEDGENHYISVWPSIVIKYNPLSTDLIEDLGKKVRKGEDILLNEHIEDPDFILECEDLIHLYCHLVDYTCQDNDFTASLNSKYTKIHNTFLNVSIDREFFENCRYPNIYLLHKTGQAFQGSSDNVLSYLNKFFGFLR